MHLARPNGEGDWGDVGGAGGRSRPELLSVRLGPAEAGRGGLPRSSGDWALSHLTLTTDGDVGGSTGDTLPALALSHLTRATNGEVSGDAGGARS